MLFSSGNRCGHDPQSPRFFRPPEEHGVRPPILVRLIERVSGYYWDPAKIPSLANALFGRKSAADPNGDHKPRRMRSERREACCSLLGALFHYCDLPTLCLSVPQSDGSLIPVSLETLAARANLALRRAERAIRDLVAAGLVTVHKRAERLEDGTFVGHASIRAIPTAVFGLFGLEARLEHDRIRLSRKRKEARETRTGNARIRTAIGAVGRPAGRGWPKPPQPAAARIPEPPAPELPRGDAPQAPPAPEPKHASHMRAIREILGCAGQGPAPESKADALPSERDPRKGRSSP